MYELNNDQCGKGMFAGLKQQFHLSWVVSKLII